MWRKTQNEGAFWFTVKKPKPKKSLQLLIKEKISWGDYQKSNYKQKSLRRVRKSGPRRSYFVFFLKNINLEQRKLS